MIQLEGIHKSFKVARRKPGLKQAFKALVSREHQMVHALTDVTFHIAKGEMVGYIGPNGAGKSTTIKVMCGVLTPDSGTCVIGGLVPWLHRKQHVARIGVVFGQRSQLWWDVPVADSFELIRDIYRVEQAAYQRRLDELCAILELDTLLATPTRSLSLGQRMRCELAASLLHNPDILFLDEPTIGLDAVSKLKVRQFISRMNREHGTTVLLTTHDMQDIEALAQRILLIGRGRILMDGTLENLRAHAGLGQRVALRYAGEAPPLLPGMTLVEQAPGRMVLALNAQPGSLSRAIQHLSASTEVLDVVVTPISAEEMVAALYKEYQL